MTTIKQAVASAMDFAAGILDKAEDLRLEEIESAEADGAPVWLITLSLRRTFGERDYKTFTVNKGTGEVLAMKIRELVGNSA
jgi:hypothetical protein